MAFVYKIFCVIGSFVIVHPVNNYFRTHIFGNETIVRFAVKFEQINNINA